MSALADLSIRIGIDIRAFAEVCRRLAIPLSFAIQLAMEFPSRRDPIVDGIVSSDVQYVIRLARRFPL